MYYNSYFFSIYTTKEVAEEFAKPLPRWILLLPVKNEAKQEELTEIVDPGEASAIALALEIENSLLIIDEKKGRRLAQQLNLQIAGTLQVLLLAKEKGIVHSLKSLLIQLENNNFRLSSRLKDEVLRKANEL